MAEKILKEEHRAKLDALVQQMEDAKEPTENIQAVVNDFKQKYEAEPSFWEKHPNLKAAAKGVTSTLPALGAIGGGMLAAPSLATGLPGLAVEAGAVGLGAGVGRGVQDLVEESTGLSPKTSPLSKGVRIGGDVALGAGTQAVLPGAIEAVKTPVKTAGEMSGLLPSWAKKLITPENAEMLRAPKGAPKPILKRPPTSISEEIGIGEHPSSVSKAKPTPISERQVLTEAEFAQQDKAAKTTLEMARKKGMGYAAYGKSGKPPTLEDILLERETR